MELRGYDLRYLITSIVGRGVTTTARIRRGLQQLGVDLGPDPRRRLHGALRSEVRKGRLRRVGRGVYHLDRIPRSTHHRIERRARLVEAWLPTGHLPPAGVTYPPSWLDRVPSELPHHPSEGHSENVPRCRDAS